MILENPRGVIELGNINIKCIVFGINNENIIEILSTEISESEGIHNGVVVNLPKATQAIRSCIGNAEKKANVSLKKINVVLEQPEFLCTKFSKERKINGSKIQKDDIEFLIKESKKQLIQNDNRQSLIHIFNHNYIVDGKNFIEEPIDVYADRLSHEMTFVTMPKNNLKNVYQTFADCDIEVERIISSTFALGTNLLNPNELEFGSTLINFGFEKTSLGLFNNFALVHSNTFPIGINHIVKDISKVCSLSIEESEKLKKKIDFSFKNNAELFDENSYLKNKYFINSNYRKISKSLLLKVVETRLIEILQMIKKQINVIGSSSTSGRNIVIVGGGSKLLNLDKYCSDFFNVFIKKLYYENKDEMEDFQACMGAIKIIKDGWETEAIPKKTDELVKKSGILGKIFRNRF